MNREVFPAVEPASPVHADLERLRALVAADPGLAVVGDARVRADLVARRRPGGTVGVRRFVWSVQRAGPDVPGGFAARTLVVDRSAPGPVTLDFPADPVLSWIGGPAGLGALHPGAARVDLLRYIPLRRVTVRLHGVPGSPERVIAKTQGTADLVQAHTVLSAVAGAASGTATFTVPRALGLDLPRRVLLLEEVPGRPLSRCWQELGATHAMERLGAVHAELHRLVVDGLPERRTGDWVTGAARAADAVALLHPSLESRVGALAGRLAGTAPDDVRPVFCQGDLVPSQVLCDPAGWSVIDLDDAHLADPYAEVAALYVALPRELSVKDERRAAEVREDYLRAYLDAAGRPLDVDRWQWHLAVAGLRLLGRRAVKGRLVPGEAEDALDRLDAVAVG